MSEGKNNNDFSEKTLQKSVVEISQKALEVFFQAVFVIIGKK